jgi:hypothetical protein
VEMLYKHDIEYDQLIPASQKAHMKESFFRLFREAKNPVV